MTEISAPILDLQTLQRTAREKNKTLWHSLSLDLQTITPVFGGGTITGEPDTLLPFRPRAIKNSLRHWWWLLNRQKLEYKENNEKLYKDMTEIWGGSSEQDGSSNRSKIRVRVQAEPLTTAHKIQSTDTEYKNLEYILWMTKQGEQEKTGATLIKPGYKFSMRIDIDRSLTAHLGMLNTVIHAWLHFGGVGARTTRGLGKVQVNSCISQPGLDIKKFFSIGDEWFIDFNKSVPQPPVIKRKEEFSNPTRALEYVVTAFRSFRQARQYGLLPTSGKVMRVNRSFWPKADVIRFMTKKYPSYHAPHEKINSNLLPTPELLFGAPIVYKFKDKKDPSPGSLTFSKNKNCFERYASPLLLTVLRVAEQTYLPASIAFPYWADVRDKQVCIESNKFIEPGVWWPDIGKEEGKPMATELLSGLVMHPAKIENDDALRERLIDAGQKISNPLVAFLKFFSTWDTSIK
jgi:CRISPR-associated protein Cmr1